MSVESLIPHSGELVLDPKDELHFRGPYEHASKASLTLVNMSDQWIAFKVLCTHTKHFLVSPPNGFLAPDKPLTISLEMLPVPKDTTAEAYLSGVQKFKVMWRILSQKPDDKENATALISAKYGQVKEAKLTCRFDQVEKSESYKVTAAPGGSGNLESILRRLCVFILACLLLLFFGLAAYHYYGEEHLKKFFSKPLTGIPFFKKLEQWAAKWANHPNLRPAMQFIERNQPAFWGAVIGVVLLAIFPFIRF